ncbi:glycosyltransferase family 2 protein [Arsenicicoccus dermatophilus]
MPSPATEGFHVLGRQPLVSVVIPAYQAQDVVGAAISSALTQSYPEVEIIVVVDGATDRTEAVAAAYADRVRVITQPNRGVSAARNTAIRAARGELIALLDADDVWLPPYLETAVRTWLAAGDPRSFVTCDAHLLTPAGFVEGRAVLPSGTPGAARQRMQILENNFVSIFSVYPKALWDELGGYDESMPVCEDYDFWAQAIFRGWTAHFVTERQAFYRRGAGSLSTQRERMYAGEQQVLRHVADRHGDRLSPPERAFLDLRLSQGSAMQQIDLGEAALRAGDRATAAERFALAARLMPSARRIRLKAELVGRIPLAAQAYARRLATTDLETGRAAEGQSR